MSESGKKLRVCTNCGEQNSSENNVCSECGIDISSVQLVDSDLNPIEEITPKDEPKVVINQKNKKKKHVEKNKANVFSSTKLLYLIIAFVVFAMINLYSSGIFDKPTVVNNPNINQNQMPQDDVHGGVDMSKLQQIKELEDAVAKNPEDYTSLLNVAHLYNDSGFFDKAIQKYKIYVAKFEKPDVLVDMGVCYYQLGEFSEARSNMEKAIKIDPKHQIGHFNLGIVNMADNKINVAKEWWTKAINLDPNSNIGIKAKELLESN